jgi:hypothetical protein
VPAGSYRSQDGSGDRTATAARSRSPNSCRARKWHGVCSNAWGQYITGSLRKLITTGRGEPNPVDEHAGHQEEVVAKVREMERKLQNEHGLRHGASPSQSPDMA